MVAPHRSPALILLLLFAYTGLLAWSVRHDPFFWDTVQLASKHAHHFYNNGLRWIPLPGNIDSGHPPVFGFYLAHVWHFFGKTLPASHAAMLPFLLLNAWLLYRLGSRFGGPERAFWLLPLALLDPVMAGQSLLVSPDVVLISGFLMVLEGVLGRNRLFLLLGSLVLCAVSIRGMMTAGALFVWNFWYHCRHFSFPVLSRRNLRALRPWAVSALFFLPGFAFDAWFLWWHRAATGWAGLPADSPWAPAFVPAQGWELLRNAAVIGWRWLDFGRVFEWLLLGWLAILYWKRRAGLLQGNAPVFTTGDGLMLLLCLVVFLSPSALLFRNLSAHRYFLPGFLALHFFAFRLFSQLYPASPKNSRTGPLVILIVLLAAGNFWVYPRGISMGWDATLAHLPYHRLRAEAVAYLEQHNIGFATVGSAFPNLNTGEHLMLNGDQRLFAELDFNRNQYVFVSNVFNDLSEEAYATLEREWVLVKRWKQAAVRVEIYRRREK